MDIAATICIGAFLHLNYLLALDLFVPKAHQAYYIQDKRDWTSYLAVLLYHGIWLAWLLNGTPPTASGNAVVGTLAFAVGLVLTVWAQRVNPFFCPTVRMHGMVIRQGPYRLFNHPGYLGFGLMSGGMLAIAATFAGACCLMVYWSILILRSFEEDKLLRRR